MRGIQTNELYFWRNAASKIGVTYQAVNGGVVAKGGDVEVGPYPTIIRAAKEYVVARTLNQVRQAAVQ